MADKEQKKTESGGMSPFQKMFQTNRDLEEEGVVVDFGEGIKVKVARIQSDRSRAVRRRLEKPYRKRFQNNDLPEDVAENILVCQMAEAIILGWEGVTDRNGNPLECTEGNIKKVLTDFPDFRDAVLQASIARETFLESEQEEDLKNS